jgi:dTDP-4-dehydrorhamnose 3,5-epimerase
MFEIFDYNIERMKVINRPIYLDNRGRFGEIFRMNDFGDEVPRFVQDNLSVSDRNVLRGMHLQVNQWQLVTVLQGSILDLTVDLDKKSPTYEKVSVIEMKCDLNNQLLIPPGVAHGFCVLSESAILHYKSSVLYGETSQYGVAWDSSQLQDLWPNKEWIISDRDLNFPTVTAFIESGVAV